MVKNLALIKTQALTKDYYIADEILMLPSSSISKSISKVEKNMIGRELKASHKLFINCCVHVNKNEVPLLPVNHSMPYGLGLYFIMTLIIQVKV